MIFDQTMHRETTERAARIAKARPKQLGEFENALLFLRSVYARTERILPALYLYLGASRLRAAAEGRHQDLVLAEAVRFATIGAIAITCRKIFDHSKGGMTGHQFAKCSKAGVEQIAEQWAKSPGRNAESALAAIALLLAFFDKCSGSPKQLLEGKTPLEKRLGLLKHYANKSGAHLTAEPFEVGIVDCAHPVAALVVVACIIRTFDDPACPVAYFDVLDAVAWDAAVRVFPVLPPSGPRMFQKLSVADHAASCWQLGAAWGLRKLTVQLPLATNWY
ncbi:hypothetical protein [Variovorax sp. RA8]|uniref:hypothetical protein n=1 Tax=Variovorax sp. (strain JCM 16519 / RA8) TaxID=662548 RepID=UPI0013A54A39|nr:hypothetical protein [Variovorax sp. RA8]